jgi:hypothetical protein
MRTDSGCRRSSVPISEQLSASVYEVGTQKRSMPSSSFSSTPPFAWITFTDATLSASQVTSAEDIPRAAASGSTGAQHRGRVAAAAGRRPDVVTNVPALAEQALCQPVPQRDPAEVTVVPEPPPGRAGHPALRPWRLLERLGTKRPHERCEALSRMPRLAEGPDLVPDHGLVDRRAAPLGRELGHCL